MPRVARSISELRKLLAKQEKKLARLEKRRTRLLRELKAVDTEIAGLGGESKAVRVGKRRGKPGKKAGRRIIRTRAGKITLREAMRQVLAKASSSLRVAEIIKRLPETGYSSSSKNLDTMVGQVLSDSGHFRRVKRGVYVLKAL